VIYRGVSRPITEVSPADGAVSILPLQLWRENEEDGDLLLWETEHYTPGPRTGRTGRPRIVCADCFSPPYLPRGWCPTHRCRAATTSGLPCGNQIDVAHPLYCYAHACRHELAPGVWCLEQATEAYGFCAAHGGQPAPAEKEQSSDA
jgi:hypothetical protein